MIKLSGPVRTGITIAVVPLVAIGLFYAFRAVHWQTRLMVGVAMALVAAWVVFSRRMDRRYAALLENEVANQTRSLMSSLGATASAERHLRLVMEAVPDAITVVDREGHVLDENSAGRALVNGAVTDDAGTGGAKRSAFGWIDGTGLRVA